MTIDTTSDGPAQRTDYCEPVRYLPFTIRPRLSRIARLPPYHICATVPFSIACFQSAEAGGKS